MATCHRCAGPGQRRRPGSGLAHCARRARLPRACSRASPLLLCRQLGGLRTRRALGHAVLRYAAAGGVRWRWRRWGRWPPRLALLGPGLRLPPHCPLTGPAAPCDATQELCVRSTTASLRVSVDVGRTPRREVCKRVGLARASRQGRAAGMPGPPPASPAFLLHPTTSPARHPARANRNSGTARRAARHLPPWCLGRLARRHLQQRARRQPSGGRGSGLPARTLRLRVTLRPPAACPGCPTSVGAWGASSCRCPPAAPSTGALPLRHHTASALIPSLIP